VTPEIKTEIPSLKLRLLKEEDAEELFLQVMKNKEYLRRWLPWLDGARDTSDQLQEKRFWFLTRQICDRERDGKSGSLRALPSRSSST
jgi:hypothetical protein